MKLGPGIYQKTLIFLFLLHPLVALSQQTIVYQGISAIYKKGLELFDHEKYGAAQKYFDDVVNASGKSPSTLRVSAEYYQAVCAALLFNNDAELLLTRFVKSHPDSKETKTAYFYLGEYHYLTRKYKKSLRWLEHVETRNLTSYQRIDFKFYLGYCYFYIKDLKKSKTLRKHPK